MHVCMCVCICEYTWVCICLLIPMENQGPKKEIKRSAWYLAQHRSLEILIFLYSYVLSQYDSEDYLGISDPRSQGPHKKREGTWIRNKMKKDILLPKKSCSCKEKLLAVLTPTYSSLSLLLLPPEDSQGRLNCQCSSTTLSVYCNTTDKH